MMGFVYGIVNLNDQREIAYVGSTTSPKRRWNQHKSDLRNGRHDNSRLQRAWNKYGEGMFQFLILEEVLVKRLIEREQYWLDEYLMTGEVYNLGFVVASPMLGRTHTEEAKRKMSEAKKGWIPEPFSKEHRQRISEGVQWANREGRVGEKISRAKMGHSVSVETRKKISDSLMGRESYVRSPMRQNGR